MLKNTSGFVYYVSMTGVTGAAIKSRGAVGDAVERIKSHTDLPVAVGFGIKTAEDAADIGKHADGIVVGTVLVDAVASSLVDGKATDKTVARRARPRRRHRQRREAGAGVSLASPGGRSGFEPICTTASSRHLAPCGEGSRWGYLAI